MKIAIYFSDEGTLGHGTRIKRIADNFKKIGHSVMIIQGGVNNPILKKDTDVLNVPFPFHSRNEYFSKKYKIDPAKISKRIIFMKNRLLDFEPDIFITEYFPLGRIEERHEMIPLLNFLKTKNRELKIFCSMGYPYLDFGLSKEIIKYSKFYDRIFIHTPQIEAEYLYREMNKELKKQYKKILNRLGGKIFFTNYIVDKNIRKRIKIKKTDIQDKNFILVSRGGGMIYPKIISSSILSSRNLSKSFFLISHGPFSTAKEIKIFQKAALNKDNVRLVGYLPDFADYLYSCDVSVSMSGYNTSVETLWLRKKSVLIPSSMDIEQVCRARILKDFLGSSVLNYKTLTPKKIGKSIKHQINNEFKDMGVDKKWFNGLEDFSKLVLKDM